MNRSEMFDVVKAHMFEIIMDLDESMEIEETDSIRDLGADSLDVAEIINNSMRDLQVTIELHDLDQINNIGGFLDLLEEAYLEHA